MRRRAPILAVTVGALLGCRFTPSFTADDAGLTNVACVAPADCVDPDTVCATVDPQSGARRCVTRAAVASLAIARLSVLRADGTPATRFSRNPGFENGRLEVELSGAPELVEAIVGGAPAPCVSQSPTLWRCAFSARAATSEGGDLARVTATDALGRVVSERQVVSFDFSAPRIVEASVSRRIVPPPSSPLAELGPQWAPTALATGASLAVSFVLDEASGAPPRATLEPGAVAFGAAAPAGTAWEASVLVPLAVPEGPAQVWIVTEDEVGNVSPPQPLPLSPALVKDDTPPAAAAVADGQVLAERRPFAADPARRGTFLTVDRGLEPDATVLVLVALSDFAVGVGRADALGSVSRLRLAVADAADLRVVAVDRAGNAAPPAAVRRYLLELTPGAGLVPNPTVVERRNGFVPELLALRSLFLSGPALASADGVTSSVDARPMWRKESFGVDDATVGVGCGAAVSDTARATMVLGGAWPGCSEAAPLHLLRGAGARRASSPLTAASRTVPVYDTRRSQAVLLPFSPSGGPLFVDTDFISRGGTPPLEGTVTTGAYDPKADLIVALSPDGGVLTYDRVAGWRLAGSVARRSGSLAFSHEREQIVLAGGFERDGGLSTQLLGFDGVDFGRVGEAPAVREPQLLWDLNAHALRLVARGTQDTWLELDGGFVAQPPVGLAVDWWASWPGRRGDTLLNPSLGASPSGAVLRGGTLRSWWLSNPAQGRGSMQAIPGPTLGEVFVGGGEENDRPNGGFWAWEPEHCWRPRGSSPELSRGAFVGDADGGVLSLGGLTLNPIDIAPNLAVRRFDAAAGAWSAIGQLPVALAPANAWRAPDGTFLTMGGLVDGGAAPGQRFSVGVNSVTELDAGPARPTREGCATVDAEGTPLLLGGVRPAPLSATAEVLRYGRSGWQVDPAMQLPRPRARHSCAYDPLRQAWYVFGGNDGMGSATLLTRSLDGGWMGAGEYAPDGTPDLRERATMAFEPKSGVTAMFGGSSPSGAEDFAEVWTLENATVRPGLVWRVPLSNLNVPTAVRVVALRASAIAGASGFATDLSPLDGFELVYWRDGQWEVMVSSPAPASALGRVEFSRARINPSWLERHSLNLGLRALGMRGRGEAVLTADAFEAELIYELP